MVFVATQYSNLYLAKVSLNDTFLTTVPWNNKKNKSLITIPI